MRGTHHTDEGNTFTAENQRREEGIRRHNVATGAVRTFAEVADEYNRRHHDGRMTKAKAQSIHHRAMEKLRCALAGGDEL